MTTDWIAETLSQLTLEEKIGQLVMASSFDISPQGLAAYREKLERYPIGGVFLFFGTQDEVAHAVTELQRGRKVPLLMGCDYENGVGYIVDNGTRFPRQMARGHAGDAESEYRIGRITAEQGRAIGMHITMSPVLDVNDDFRCPDVNIRAYGDDTDTIRGLGVPYIRGLQEHGMLATAKHFPGNGGSGMDQHISAALLLEDRETIVRKRLPPFRDAIEQADVAAVMVGHLEVPALTSERVEATGRALPATLSREVLDGLLRKELGFDGLIISDAMDMGGVSNQFTRAEAAVRAIEAGIDMLLVFSGNAWHLEYEALVEAARADRLSLSRIDAAVRRVLAAKERAGLHEDGGLPRGAAVRAELFAPGRDDAFCQEIAEKAVTVLVNRGSILPLRGVSGSKLLVINAYSPERKTLGLHGQRVPPVILDALLRERGASVDLYEITNETPHEELGRLRESLQSSDAVLYNFIGIPSWGIGTMIPNRGALGLFYRGLFSMGKPVVVTALGDPYVAYYCPAAPAFVATFDEGLEAQRAVVRVWCGESKATGRMPVRLAGVFERGDGVDA
jgi:beta-N-acetylhexosaminidase